MNARTFFPLASTLMAYLTYGVPAVELRRGEGPESQEEVFTSKAEVRPAVTWRTTTHTKHWMLTKLPSDWVPKLDNTLMKDDPLTYLYSLKEMEANLVKNMLQNSARGHNDVTEEEARTLEKLTEAYECMKFRFPCPPRAQTTYKSATEKLVESSAKFWAFLQLFRTKAVAEEARKHTGAAQQVFLRCSAVVSKIPRHQRMKRLYRLLQRAKQRLLYKWWNSRDMDVIFALLAEALHVCSSSTAESTSLKSPL